MTAAERGLSPEPAAGGPRWVGPALALAALCWLLAPSVAWFDSGELAAAARSLGIPHPTGFSAFVLAGHALGELPLASGALRVHLLGALCSVLAVVCWRRALGVPWPTGTRPALAEGLTCLLPLSVGALSLHIRAAEVYPPTWLVAAASAWVWQWGARRGPMLALLAGLGACVHVEAALIPGLAALAALVADGQRSPRTLTLQGAVAQAVGAAAGALTLVYLPLAAGRDPLFSWGDVRSLPALIDHLTAASIRTAFAQRMGDASGGLAALAHLIARDGRWLLAPALLGVAAMWRLRRAAVVPTLALMAVDAVYSAFVNPMGLRDDQAGLLVLLGLCVLAAEGFFALARWLPAGDVLGAVAAVALIVGGLQQRGDHWGQADLQAGAGMADLLLQRAAPGQVSITSSDHASSACIWLQAAEGVRPDAPCVPGVFLRDDRMTAQQARVWGRSQWLSAIGKVAPAARLGAWLPAEARAAPVRWELGLAPEDGAIAGAYRPGLVWGQVVAPDLPAAAVQPDLATQAAAVCALVTGDPGCGPSPTLRAALAADLAVQAARAAGADGALALHLARAAARLDPTPKALNNLASLLMAEDPSQALALCEQALDREPDYLRAHRTAARAAARLGDPQALARHLKPALDHAGPEGAKWLESLRQDAAPGVRQLLQPQ